MSAAASAPFATVVGNRLLRVAGCETERPIELECLDTSKLEIGQIAARCSDEQTIDLAVRVAMRIPLERGQQTETCVYVLEPVGSDGCKVGMTNNPRRRLNRIQSERPEPLRIHSLFWMVRGHASMLEAIALRVAGERNIRGEGEWLTCMPSAAAVMIASIVSVMDLKVADSATWLCNRRRVSLAREAAKFEASNQTEKMSRLRHPKRPFRGEA